MTNTPHQFTGDEIIADVLMDFPTAHEVLAAHGIACAGCHINQYETLRDGIKAHYGDEMFLVVMKDLNEASEELGHESNGNKKDPVITDTAKAKILEFQKDSNKAGYGFKIEVVQEYGEPSYFLDFAESPDRGDKVVETNGVKIFCDIVVTNGYRIRRLIIKLRTEKKALNLRKLKTTPLLFLTCP